MDMLALYALFAVTTAATGIYELIIPVLESNKLDWTNRPSKYLFYAIFFSMFVLAAPLVVFSCLIPSWGIVFRETILNVILEET